MTNPLAMQNNIIARSSAANGGSAGRLSEAGVPNRVGDELEIELRPLGVRPDKANEVLRGRANLLRRDAITGEPGLEALEFGSVLLVQHDQEELLLALEVRVEGALRVAGIRDDLLHGGSLQASAAEQPSGRVQQCRPRLRLALGTGE